MKSSLFPLCRRHNQLQAPIFNALERRSRPAHRRLYPKSPPAGYMVQREVLRESKGDSTVIQKYIISLPPYYQKELPANPYQPSYRQAVHRPQQAVQEVRTGRYVVSHPKAESHAGGPLPRRHGVLYADPPQSRPHELNGGCQRHPCRRQNPCRRQ